MSNLKVFNIFAGLGFLLGIIVLEDASLVVCFPLGLVIGAICLVTR